MAKKKSKKVEKIEVFVCPKCQSTNVGYTFGVKNIFGIVPRMKCKDCKFESMTFPKWVIDKDKITNQHKPVDFSKQKSKTKNPKRANYKAKITERYCPHCDDQVKVKMKDGTVSTFVCENCQFEIKYKKKKK